ncbi:phosphoglycerate mutase-like protein [Rickenella mellea]|uniref:Phosphoglycerate mutase-like protein n=1 Tax=Rickenella mellea TaxID=50990 RepID=A0A4Y7QMA2_9AGAM|nr:phosphoglycerate mutase-like protein [Rickenella mellea]
MIETIYIVRHGFRLNWVTTKWKSPTGLPRDPPLAALGESQAEELANYFASLPGAGKPTAIFSSPYYRCLQTAQPTSDALHVPIHQENVKSRVDKCQVRLSEWYSPVKPGTGLHPRPKSAIELRNVIPQIDPTWSSVWFPSRRGETIEEAHDRTAGCLRVLVPVVERKSLGQHKSILLVSHAATVITLVRELIGHRDLSLRVGCCSLTKLCRMNGRTDLLGAWTPVTLTDGSHLAEGALRDWGFEDVEIENGQVVHDSGVPGTQSELDDKVGNQVVDILNRL